MFRYFVLVGDPDGERAEQLGVVADESQIDAAEVVYLRDRRGDSAYHRWQRWQPTTAIAEAESGRLPYRLVEVEAERGTEITRRIQREHSVANWNIGRQERGELELRVGGLVPVSRDASGAPAGFVPLRPAEREKVARWLSTAPIAAASRGTVGDPFDPDGSVFAGANIRTDGAWVWRESLALLVRRYGIPLEDEFLTHAHSRLYRLPKMLGDDVLARAARLALGTPVDTWGVVLQPTVETGPDQAGPDQAGPEKTGPEKAEPESRPESRPEPTPSRPAPVPATDGGPATEPRQPHPPAADWVTVPGAAGPSSPIRDQFPESVGGFAVAVPERTADVFRLEAGQDADRDRLVAYLYGCRQVLSVPDGWCAIEGAVHATQAWGGWATDGTWLVAQALLHYVQEHQTAVPERLASHIRALGYQPPAVPDEVAAAGRAAAEGIVAGRWRLATEWAARHGLHRSWAPDRFPPSVAHALHHGGWYRGRDLAYLVEQVVTQCHAEHARHGNGTPLTVPSAAIAAMREFGGVSRPIEYSDDGYRTVGFSCYPHTTGPDAVEYSVECLTEALPATTRAAAGLGQALFPIGRVMGADEKTIAVAEDGRAFLIDERAAIIEAYLSVDAALTALVQYPPERDEHYWGER